MCLVNQENPDDQISLPGLKPLLSKSSSLFASWFLSGYTGTSFWTLYSVIMDENNCQVTAKSTNTNYYLQKTIYKKLSLLFQLLVSQKKKNITFPPRKYVNFVFRPDT